MILDITTKNGENLKIYNEDLVTFEYLANTTSTSEFDLGGAIPCSFNFTIFDHGFKKYNLYNAKVIVYIGDEINENNLLGTFTTTSTDIEQDVIVCQSDDDLSMTYTNWKGRSFPCTIWELLTNICNQVKVSLLNTKEDLINADIIINSEKDLKGKKCKEILKWIGEANGMFCIMTPNNNLVFKKYDFQNIKEIAQGDITDLKLEQVNTTRRGVSILNNGVNHSFGETTFQIKIDSNGILKNLSNDQLIACGNNMVTNIKEIDFYAGTFNIWENNYNLKVGDIVKVIDDDGEEFITIIHDITMDNEDEFYSCSSFGDSIEDKMAALEDEPSTGDTTSDEESSEVYLGRGQNHQRISIKGGTYTICEKLIDNVTAFSKVNLNFFVNFNYNQTKMLYFDIYANDKLVKHLKHSGTPGFNQYNAGFFADIDLESTRNIFSCKITLDDSDLINIEPFECQMSFIVKSATISDAIATNQYFIEKYDKISNQIFNPKRFTIKNLQEQITTKILLYRGDVSETEGDGNVFADIYDNGELEIWGNGKTADFGNGLRAFGFRFPCSYNEFKQAAANITNATIMEGVTHAGSSIFAGGNFPKLEKIIIPNSVLSIGANFANSCTALQELYLLGSNPISFTGGAAFYNCSKLTNLYGSHRLSLLKGEDFRNCDLTGEIDISNCVIEGGGSFMNNTNLTYAKLPCPLPLKGDIGFANYFYDNLFYGCSNLDGVIVFGIKQVSYDESVIKETAFQGTKIQNIVFRADFNMSWFRTDCNFIKRMGEVEERHLWVCCGDNYIEKAKDEPLNDQITILVENNNCVVHYYTTDQEQEVIDKVYNQRS